MEICPICLNRRPLVWDHDHATGKVRGRICGQCNSGLGLFAENVNTFQRATVYLASEPDGRLFADIKREYMTLRMRAWREKNPEREREGRRRRYAANPEAAREASRKYKANDPDGAKARAFNARHKAWLSENPEKAAEYDRRKREKYQALKRDPEVMTEINRRARENHRLRKERQTT